MGLFWITEYIKVCKKVLFPEVLLPQIPICPLSTRFKTNIDVDDYDTEEDYRNALILDCQETYDPQHQFKGFNFDKFTTIDDYLVELNDRLNLIKECDAEGKYSKIDASNYDNLIQYKHQINLRKAWKNKYDPNNEHTNIDPFDYNDVEEYHEAIKHS